MDNAACDVVVAKAEVLTVFPTCGEETLLVDKTAMTGRDMRTRRGERCGKEHIVNSDLLCGRSCTTRESPTVTRRNLPRADDNFRR